VSGGSIHEEARSMSLDRSDNNGFKPTLALAMGDPAGISPELTAKLLALDEVRS
jgi:hypothetical protein